MSTDTPTEAVPALPSRGDLPPLRIYHVLACMAVAAAIFLSGAAYVRAMLGTLGTALHAVGMILDAVASTCLIFGIAWWLRGKKFPSEPGHGLLIRHIPHLIWVLQMALLAGYLRPASFEGQDYYDFDATRPYFIRWLENWSEAIISSGAVLISIICLIWLAHTLAWRLFFAVAALEQLIYAIVMSLWALFGRAGNPWSDFFEYTALRLLPASLVVLALLFAVSTDVWKHASRHWSHWCGVIVCLLQTSITIFVFALAAWREW